MVKIICSWCGKEDEYSPSFKTKDGEIVRNPIRCTGCFRQIPSSIKNFTGNVVGTSHIHKEYK